MTAGQDAVTAALERQVRELAGLLARLRRARHQLVPEPSPAWRGPARHAFDAAVLLLAEGITATVDDVLLAHRETLRALHDMAAP